MVTPLFPTGSLALQRALNEQNLPLDAELQVPTTVRSPGGVVTRTFATQIVTKCRISEVGAGDRERYTADQLQTPRTSILIFPYDTPLRADHRIRVADATTRLFDIIGDVNVPSFAVLIRVLCREVTP